jgi:hypothetical protein
MAIRSTDAGGRPVSVEVLDGHHHVGVADRSTWASADWRARDLDERVAYTRANDIDRFVALPSLNITLEHTNELYARVNSMVAAYRADAPDVVAGAFGAVNPLVTDTALTELERCFTDLDLAGVVFHHRFLGITVDHPSMGPVVELAQAHDKVVAVHVIAESNLESAWRLFSLARRYPDARFLALDGFSSADRAPTCATSHPTTPTSGSTPPWRCPSPTGWPSSWTTAAPTASSSAPTGTPPTRRSSAPSPSSRWPRWACPTTTWRRSAIATSRACSARGRPGPARRGRRRAVRG